MIKWIFFFFFLFFTSVFAEALLTDSECVDAEGRVINMLAEACAAGEVNAGAVEGLRCPCVCCRSKFFSMAGGEYVIEGVIDGQTLKLTSGEEVLLAGVDTRANESRAVAFLRSLLDYSPNRRILLETAGEGKDSRGRIPAHVTLFHLDPARRQDYVNRGDLYIFDIGHGEALEYPEHPQIYLNASLLKAGHATLVPSEIDEGRAEIFKELHADARRYGVGLWRPSVVDDKLQVIEDDRKCLSDRDCTLIQTDCSSRSCECGEPVNREYQKKYLKYLEMCRSEYKYNHGALKKCDWIGCEKTKILKCEENRCQLVFYEPPESGDYVPSNKSRENLPPQISIILEKYVRGDVDNDGDCDEQDKEVFMKYYGKCQEDGYNELADADHDGCITQKDWMLLFPCKVPSANEAYYYCQAHSDCVSVWYSRPATEELPFEKILICRHKDEPLMSLETRASQEDIQDECGCYGHKCTVVPYE